MKLIDFKSAEPFFSQERDGIKPFTIRLIDYKDKRFRALSQWEKGRDWGLRITNPATGEVFCRHLKDVSYLPYMDWSEYKNGGLGYFRFNYAWEMLIMGEIIQEPVLAVNLNKKGKEEK